MQSISRAQRRRSSREATKRAQWAALEEFTRNRIQDWIQDLLEEEVVELLGRRKSERRAAVDGPEGYRNGYGKLRRLSMMAGTVALRRPRLRGLEQRFESRILPLFVRRTEQVSELLPQLYLHGLAQGDFELALRGLLGEGAPLSPSSIERLRVKWQLEYEAWRSRRLEHLELVYVWADGLYVKAGLEDHKAALLVIIGALKDGRKVLLAIEAGQRESKESWARVLRDLFARGLKPWKVTVADGHLGIWSALGELCPAVEEQRCWNHRLVNVIDLLPKKEWPAARERLRQIPYAETRVACERLRDQFAARYRQLYPKAVETLCRDWERMVSFYRFPRDHWIHLRTTNVVESPFSAVRLRTDAARRYKKVANAEALIWKILTIAEQKFRRLNAPELLEQVYNGQRFKDGIEVHEMTRTRRAA
jgi:putative transposase